MGESSKGTESHGDAGSSDNIKTETETLQSRRTRRAIDEAFIGLLGQESFRQVTVTQIADRALVNRQTFYNYYRDKYELTTRLSDRMMALFDRLIDERMEAIRQGVPLTQSLRGLKDSGAMDALFARRQTILRLLRIQFDGTGLRGRLEERVDTAFTQMQDPALSPFVRGIYAAGFVTVVTRVLEDGRLPDDGDIALVARMARRIF